jgi:hypothetical protein
MVFWKGRKMLELSEIKKDVTWEEAMDYAKELGEGWRLPTKEELAIIANSPRSKEFATEWFFWSSSASVNFSDSAWFVGLGDGYADIDHKGSTYAVRYIRGSFEDLITWCFHNEITSFLQSICKNCMGKKSGVDAHNDMEWSWLAHPWTFDLAQTFKRNGWRLPTVQELVNIFDYDNNSMVKGLEFMKGGIFWSSSAEGANNAWAVNLGNGNLHSFSKGSLYQVAVVRKV